MFLTEACCLNAVEAWAGTSDFSNMYRQFAKRAENLVSRRFFSALHFQVGQKPPIGQSNFRISVQAGYLLIVLGQLNSYWLPPAFQ